MKKCKNLLCKNTIPSNSRSIYCSEECKRTKNEINRPDCENPTCNNKAKKGSDGRWRKFCSEECNKAVTIPEQSKTRNATWADPVKKTLILEKYKETSIKNTGVDHSMKLDLVKDLRKQHSIEKYGTDHHLKSDLIQDKRVNTVLEKYGNINVSQNHISAETLMKMHSKDFLESECKIKSVSAIANELGISSSNLYVICAKYGITEPTRSGFEKEVVDFISSLGIATITNSRKIIPPKEIDIFLPEYNIAIECNGTWHHSELAGKDKRYHINKTISCNEKGIHLLHLWEHNWKINNALIKSRIRSLLGLTGKIYARKCDIREVSAGIAREFLNNNHIQGFTPSTIRLGLFFDNELVSLMTFGSPRFNKTYEVELLRFCNKINTSVVGGASKLFRRYIDCYKPSTILSYSDRSWNTGNLYQQLGFIKLLPSGPAPNYTRDYITIEHRLQLRKSVLYKKLKDFNPDMSDWDNLKNNGYNRFWDCGNDVFLWINTKTN